MKKASLIIMALALVGCGQVSQITPEIVAFTEPKLPNIDPRGGQLCIFRASNFLGATTAVKLYANTDYIGRLTNGSYFCTNLEPGEYIISTGGSLSRAGAEINIVQSRRKFMELYVGSGIRIDAVIPEVGLAGIYDTM